MISAQLPNCANLIRFRSIDFMVLTRRFYTSLGKRLTKIWENCYISSNDTAALEHGKRYVYSPADRQRR